MVALPSATAVLLELTAFPGVFGAADTICNKGYFRVTSNALYRSKNRLQQAAIQHSHLDTRPGKS